MIIIAKREKEQKKKTFISSIIRSGRKFIFQNSKCHQQHSLEPVGDRHHDIERSQEEDKMEVGVAVDGPLPLVVHHILARAGLLLIIVVLKKEKWQKDAEENRGTE